MLTKTVFPDELQLRVDRVGVEDRTVVISVTSTSEKSVCPHCETVSERIHSCYQRHPADLPLAGCAVRLDMNIHRFFCDNHQCETRTFAERVSDLLKPYAHRTNRLANQQRRVAFDAGGEAGARLLNTLGMPVSHDTLLRLIRNAPEPGVNTPRVLGIDDWAKRKGQSYGTILVVLEAHQPVDLLPDSSAELVAEWLKAHPGIEIISRDRGVEYIKGATDGAPDAIQIADRWHLLKNLRDTLKRLLESKRDCLRAAAEEVADEPSESKQEEISPADIEAHAKPVERVSTSASTEQEKQARYARRQERYKAVLQLHQQGFSIRGIARRLKLSRPTVRKYIEAETCPMYPAGVKRMAYIQQRWKAGCHNASQIWRELGQLGFDGSRGLVALWVAKKRQSLPQLSGLESPSEKKVAPWSPSRASWLLVKQEEDLTDDDRQALERMKQADERVAEAYTLGQRFTCMVRERQPESLPTWLEDVANSDIRALTGFANGIKQDLDAVTNALSLPWSNGQTEGQVNRLKLIKRQMHGRADFDLLRKRVLFRPMRC